MNKHLRLYSFLLGLLAFGSQVLADAMGPTPALMASAIGLLAAMAAGYMHAPANLYVVGMVKAMTFWIGWGLVTGTSHALLLRVPLLLAWTPGVAVLGFYLGKRIRIRLDSRPL